MHAEVTCPNNVGIYTWMSVYLAHHFMFAFIDVVSTSMFTVFVLYSVLDSMDTY